MFWLIENFMLLAAKYNFDCLTYIGSGTWKHKYGKYSLALTIFSKTDFYQSKSNG